MRARCAAHAYVDGATPAARMSRGRPMVRQASGRSGGRGVRMRSEDSRWDEARWAKFATSSRLRVVLRPMDVRMQEILEQLPVLALDGVHPCRSWTADASRRRKSLSKGHRLRPVRLLGRATANHENELAAGTLIVKRPAWPCVPSLKVRNSDRTFVTSSSTRLVMPSSVTPCQRRR